VSDKSNTSAASGGGIGLAGVLGVVFIVLKLTGNITWSWWWVLSPWWISFALVAVIILLVIAWAVIGSALEQGRLNRRMRR
jgi:membrane protein YdbS with pleckstrin-like domain